MAEGERVEWPEVTIQKDTTAEGGWYFLQPGDKPRARAHVASETYLPVSQVRERLEAALGLLPCDCPGRGLTDPTQHADECAIGIGGRMIDAALLDQQEGEHRG